LSGSTRFPEIGERPYFVNVGPFAFYWFTLERQRAEAALTEDVPLLPARTWDEVFSARNRDTLARAVARYVRSRRWFGGKARTITSLSLRDTVMLPHDAGVLALVDIEYADAEPDIYLLPLAMAQARRAEEEGTRSATLIARMRDGFLLYEPVSEPKFA